MPVSTRALMIKPNGTAVPATFFAANAAAIAAALPEGGGGSGTDGREVELQANVTHLQWRYVGDASWTPLIAISEITGAPGTNGSNGSDGATWRSGSGAPSDATGRDGDYYLRTSNGDVYRRDSGAYGVILNLKGPQGDQGETGAGGSGSELLFASASVNGPAVAAVAAGGALGCVIVDGAWSNTDGGQISVSVNGSTAVVFSVSAVDPENGTLWVDSSGLLSATGLVSALQSAFESYLSGVGVTNNESDTVSLETIATGSSVTLAVTCTVPNITASGNTSGNDAASALGAVLSADLALGVAGKRWKILRAWLTGELDANIFLTDGTTSLTTTYTPAGTLQEIQPDNTTFAAWFAGCAEGAPLSVEVSGSPAPATGLSATVHVIAVAMPV